MNSRNKILAAILCLVAVALAVTLGLILGGGGSRNQANVSTPPEEAEVVNEAACPTEFETPFSFLVDAESIEIQVSQPDTLCTLVQVSADGKFLSPVARSYHGLDWEVSAGRFARLGPEHVSIVGCTANACTMTLPPVPSEGAVYQLTTFQKPSYSNKDVAARFLEQTTFGPTRSEINQFSASSDTEFAQWIALQQGTVPVMSHREIYRRHLNARFEVNSPIGPVTQPCQSGTRYRWTAFSIKDVDKFVHFRTIDNLLSRDKIVLSVDGHDRTVMDAPVNVWYPEGGDEGNIIAVDWQDGNYRVCWVFEDMENAVLLLDHPELGECVPVIFNKFVGNVPLYVSNPPVMFDSEILPSLLVEIPDNSAEPIDAIYFEEFQPRRGKREIIVTKDIGDAMCDQVDPKSDEPVFARYDGTLWIHDPRFRLYENTLHSPLAGGGSELVQEFANTFNPEFTTQCSNVPRTFLNQDTCILSTASSACRYKLGDEWNDYPEAYFQVTPETIRAVYDVTGGGEEGSNTVYMYAIEGLDITRDSTVTPPCHTPSVSRWISVQCSSAANQDITQRTSGLLSNLIGYFQEENENPYMVDVYHPEDLGFGCSSLDRDKIGMAVPDVNGGGNCWKNVHPDHWNVYDFTHWTRTHPGNINGRNPIQEFAQAGSTYLTFPDWHELSRWHTNKVNFAGPIRLGDWVHYFDLPFELQSEQLAIALGIEFVGETSASIGTGGSRGTIVCGSPNEVANDPYLGGSVGRGAFDAYTEQFLTTFELLYLQRQIVWTNAALTDPGQLRQRAAWALSQILVVSPQALSEGELFTEAFLVYYDIFVRNAFGNYRDILREVSFSRVMAGMLTYYGGRSTAYVWEEEGNLEYADENFAREIMQLFTTGLFLLHQNGTEVLDAAGVHERVYSNDDIEEYARAWTGFLAQRERGNAEMTWENPIDPMYINSYYRDRFPKMGLNRKYVGDGYPTCVDLPRQHFLARGAKYHLVGDAPRPELHDDPIEWLDDENAAFLVLGQESQLYGLLCEAGTDGGCKYRVNIILERTVPCTGDECDTDTVRIVEVNGMYYEYGRPPCVHQAFYGDGRTIARRWDWEHAMCGDPRIEMATVACCEGEYEAWAWAELYNGERTTYAKAKQRCQGSLCDRENSPTCDEEVVGMRCYDNDYYWTDDTCSQAVMIDTNGKIAILHLPLGVDNQDVDSSVSATEAKTFFRADWNGDFGEILSGCESISSCRTAENGMCGCHVAVEESQVFHSTPTREEVLSMLSVGAFEPSGLAGRNYNGFRVYNPNGGNTLTADSIFEVQDKNGVRRLLKNTRSMVFVGGTGIAFRNPPHFINLSDSEPRDAYYETEAVLDHYFYHTNTAPFLAIRFAQRFGISNPSPRYVSSIAKAFQSGVYSFEGEDTHIEFGSREYGDLAATFAAVLLDREARTTTLDSDPAHGSLKEPLIKVLGLMRSLDFQLNDDEPWVEFGFEFAGQIGQMAHQIPNVFSFFLPEYQPSGRVAQGSLVSPEAQLLTGPRIIDSMNGMFSLIRYGLNHCYGGFGNQERDRNVADCEWIGSRDYDESFGIGQMTYSPADGVGRGEIIDDLATLLTAGRLSSENRRIIEESGAQEEETDFATLAQLLITTSPEFHATNLVRKKGMERESDIPQPPSSKPYKAVVYVLLEGGFDSYNMLAPHTCAETNANGQTLLEQYYSERTTIAVTDDERSLVIEADGQPCTQFAIHNDLQVVERLYKEGDLSFFANVGALDAPVTKDDYYSVTRTELFAHNTMQQGAQRIDPWDTAPGTGILGRMTDILVEKSFAPQPITVEDATVATIGMPGASISPIIVSSQGLNEFDAKPEEVELDVTDYVSKLNDATSLHSSVFAETWSEKLEKAISDSEELVGALEEVELTQAYGDSDSYLSKIKAVSSLILTHEDRGIDRDVLFLQLGGWDHHERLKANLSTEFQRLNGALETFEKEMKAQGLWDQVTLVVTSEFARTLTANSGEGSDHAWGGNYFIMGGDVRGGQIHGNYPADITASGPLNIGRGRLIPTLSWESMFNPVLQWMGLQGEDDLDYCMPNRINAGTRLYAMDEVFETSTRTLRGG